MTAKFSHNFSVNKNGFLLEWRKQSRAETQTRKLQQSVTGVTKQDLKQHLLKTKWPPLFLSLKNKLIKHKGHIKSTKRQLLLKCPEKSWNVPVVQDKKHHYFHWNYFNRFVAAKLSQDRNDAARFLEVSSDSDWGQITLTPEVIYVCQTSAVKREWIQHTEHFIC